MNHNVVVVVVVVVVVQPEMVQSMLEYETTEVACGAHHVIAITGKV